MKRIERIYQLHQTLKTCRGPVNRDRLCDELGGCSSATLNRLIQEMRDTLHAPIETIRGEGYRYRKDSNYELPGLWFKPDELHALLATHELLNSLSNGLLRTHIAPLRQRIIELLEHSGHPHTDIRQRIHLSPSAKRSPELPYFSRLFDATLQRQRIRISYHARGKDHSSERDLSPQRLSYYRENWYLDAWCHLRRGLRSFALENIHTVKVLQHKARDISPQRLKQHFDAGYGVFAGKPAHTAHLRFTAYRARWTQDESWHPEQSGHLNADGSYELHLPYHDPTELILDICRYGPDVTVLAPDKLRQAVAKRLHQAAAQYDKKK